jgi:hypothetical protein
MEIKVHVNGAVRILHGLTKSTTVRDILTVMARSLDHAGRHFLVEMKRPRSSKARSSKCGMRLMSQTERPIELLDKHSAYTDMSASVEIEFYLIAMNENMNDESGNDDLFVFLLNSVHLKQSLLESELADLNSQREEADVLIEMFEARLRAQDCEIEKRKRVLESLEDENQLLNCCLYKIVSREAIGYLDVASLEDVVNSSSSEVMSDESASSGSRGRFSTESEYIKSNKFSNSLCYF